MSLKVDIIRLEQSKAGTFGVMKINGQIHCVTLEPNDQGNAENISCIPEGRYTCRRVNSPRFGKTFEVCDVPNRTHILIHPGNVIGDTHGCILLGRQFGLLRGDRAILNSGKTFAGFMLTAQENETFELDVSNVSGGA